MSNGTIATVIIPPDWAVQTATPDIQFSAEDLREVAIRHYLAEREHYIALAINAERTLAALGREVSKPLCGR